MERIFIWSLLAFFSTLAGSILLAKQEWSKANIWRILAFASGILLGVAFLHLIPEAMHLSAELAPLGVLSSFFLLFVLEGFTMMHSCLEYAEGCDIHLMGWIAFGSLALHSIFDGIAIAIAFQNNVYLGMTVASAILIHKLADGLTLTGLLLGSGFERRKSFFIVMLLALATPLGAILFYPLSHLFSAAWMGYSLGFIAGIFFYVGAADILPRLHKVKDFYCLGSFTLGLILGGFLR